jgi:transposase
MRAGDQHRTGRSPPDVEDARRAGGTKRRRDPINGLLERGHLGHRRELGAHRELLRRVPHDFVDRTVAELVAPSFVPCPEIRRLRNLTRYRVQLMGDRTRDAVRLERLLEDASIRLSAVASSVTTLSAREMLAQLVAGNTDAVAMAGLAHGKMRRKLPDLAEALTGHFDAHHALLVGEMLHRLDHVETALAELDVMIAAAMTPWAHQLELLQTIPGVGLKTAQVIIAETGGDMAQFPTGLGHTVVLDPADSPA